MIGQTLAHYQITQKIGAGGMGEVYRATDSRLHREVAVKVISPEFARDPERMARFEREAHVLASLSHGSIAAVYGLEDANGSKALVMELVEGEDLSERLRRGPLPLDEVLRIGAQIAEALEAAHEQGVIHRDLKPANIKLLADGHVKLLDFGLAKALEDAGPAHRAAGDTATLSLAATRAGIILGTAAYMSPEQATGAAVDRRADVWSFGVVLFELLTGRRLFEGETTSHTLAEVIRAEIDFTRLPKTTPRELRDLLQRCLQRDPKRRLRDIREARLALEGMLERTAEPSTLRSAPIVVRRQPAGWRTWLPWALCGLLGAVATAAWLSRPPAASTPTLRLDVRMTDGALFQSAGSAIALSPDGEHLALVTGTDVSRELWIRRLDQLDNTRLAGGSQIASMPYQPFFSPDGAWVGYVTASELRKVPASGGTSLTICRVDRPRGASWGPGDTIVLAPSPESGLVRVAAAGGEPQPLTTLDASRKELTHRWPQILPGGDAVLFTSHTQVGPFDDARIEVAELADGSRKVIHNGGAFAQYVPSGHLIFVNGGTLFAASFDVDRRELTGTPVPVVQGLNWDSSQGAAHLAFSRTGMLAYVRGEAALPRFPIVWVDRNGAISRLLDEPGTYANPRLSPDGRRLSLTVLRDGNWDIWTYDLDRHVMTRLTFTEALDTEQVWSPDGRELIFSSDREGSIDALYRKPADGSGEERLVAKGDSHLWATTWSPDGKLLGVTAPQPGRQFDLALVSVGDGELQWIQDSPFLEANAAFSPDGQWIAYTSTESGRNQVYVRPVAGAGRWQISDAGGSYPRFNSNGREIFYRTDAGIMVASLDVEGTSLRTGKPRQVFAGRFLGGLTGIGIAGNTFADYDVAPDGSRFVMFPASEESEEGQPGLVTLVSNWFADLERTTSAGR